MDRYIIITGEYAEDLDYFVIDAANSPQQALDMLTEYVKMNDVSVDMTTAEVYVMPYQPIVHIDHVLMHGRPILTAKKG